jgi:hypothetical protein
MVCLLWCVVGLVGAAPRRINPPQLYSYTDDDIHGEVSELMSTSYRSFRSASWSSCRCSDMGRSVSRPVDDVCLYTPRRWGPGQGGCSRARILPQRWWFCRYSSSSWMGCGRSWSNITQRRPPIDVPHRYLHRCLQRACSSTHKGSFAMVLFWIWQWRRLAVSSKAHIDGVGFGGDRWLRRVQETIGIVLYFLIL